MILELLSAIFRIITFLFGLGALLGLIGIGLVLLWFALRVLVWYGLRAQPADRYLTLRKLFLDL